MDEHTERANRHEEAALARTLLDYVRLGYIEEGIFGAASREAKLPREETLQAIECCKNGLGELQTTRVAIELLDRTRSSFDRRRYAKLVL